MFAFFVFFYFRWGSHYPGACLIGLDWLASEPWGFLSPSPHTGIRREHYHVLLFRGFWGSNAGPHVFSADTVPTELSLQPILLLSG